MTEKKCPVCLRVDGFKSLGLANNEDAIFLSCPCCGEFKADRICYLDPTILNGERHLLAGFLRHQNLRGNRIYYVHQDVYEEIKGKVAEDHSEKCLAILRFLHQQSGGTTREVKLHPTTEYTVGYCYEGREFVHLVNDMKGDNLLEIVHTGGEETGWKVRLKTKGLDVATGKRTLGEEHMGQARNTYNITINGPVAALQSGDGSVANVVQNVGANTEELLALLTQIKEVTQSSSPSRAREIIELVDDSTKELNSPTQNRPKLLGLLGALATLIQTTDSLANLYQPMQKILAAWGISI